MFAQKNITEHFSQIFINSGGYYFILITPKQKTTQKELTPLELKAQPLETLRQRVKEIDLRRGPSRADPSRPFSACLFCYSLTLLRTPWSGGRAGVCRSLSTQQAHIMPPEQRSSGRPPFSTQLMLSPHSYLTPLYRQDWGITEKMRIDVISESNGLIVVARRAKKFIRAVAAGGGVFWGAAVPARLV